MQSPEPSHASETGARLTAGSLCCLRGEQVLFRDLDLDLGPGEILQVQGANGSGKTTLLRALCGLVPLEAGWIAWGGLDIGEADSLYRAVFNYVGHLPGVKHDLTPKENLATARALAKAPPGEPIESALGRFGLLGREHTPLRYLSAGQCRRVALARLLVTPTPLWLLDEPLTALDAAGRHLVEVLLTEHCRAGGMAIIATHYPLTADGTVVHDLRIGT